MLKELAHDLHVNEVISTLDKFYVVIGSDDCFIWNFDWKKLFICLSSWISEHNKIIMLKLLAQN